MDGTQQQQPQQEEPITMEHVIAMLQHLQRENQGLINTIAQLQANQARLTVIPTPIATVTQEPKISLPEKFDGAHSQFRSFINQAQLIIHLHPHRYPDDASRVGLIGTLLKG